MTAPTAFRPPAQRLRDMVRRPPLPTPRGPLSDGVIDRVAFDAGESTSCAAGRSARPAHRRRRPARAHLLLRARLLGLRRCRRPVGARAGAPAGPAELEHTFVRSIVREIGAPETMPPTQAVAALRDARRGDGPSLSGWVAEHATVEHLREFCIHRSRYQLKEADPHTWVIPRRPRAAKAAFVRDPVRRVRRSSSRSRTPRPTWCSGRVRSRWWSRDSRRNSSQPGTPAGTRRWSLVPEGTACCSGRRGRS